MCRDAEGMSDRMWNQRRLEHGGQIDEDRSTGVVCLHSAARFEGSRVLPMPGSGQRE